MLIQEVILENFMSYEYARVPFRSGVNVIVGPNGSGKSSLLLAISVDLGQSYTERSKKLSDLIRWGKDQARVTLILDNSRRGKNRPVPKYDKDQLFLTRVLRRDGQYWFELENKAVTKMDVERLLGRLGVDPNNILIIMHQNMVEQFTVLSTQEKLRTVEAAVGLGPYRENVLQAQKKLTRILSQEESMSKILESAEQTLHYWREQYDRFQEKKQLQTKRRFLERELAWSEVLRREASFTQLDLEHRRELSLLSEVENDLKSSDQSLQSCIEEHEKLRHEGRSIFTERLSLEREKAGKTSTIRLYEELLEETAMLNAEGFSKQIAPILEGSELKLLKSQNLKELMYSSTKQLSTIEEEIKENERRATEHEETLEKTRNSIIESRIKQAILKYRMQTSQSNVDNLQKVLKEANRRVEEATVKAEQVGTRIAVLREPSEILDEIHLVDGHLGALSDVSEDIERMYESYSKLYIDLKQKTQVVAENRQKTLEEVKTRMQAWRTVIQSLMDRINLEYQKTLTQAQALGEVRLTNSQDVEAAGLEILVGFKGGKPVPLDAYTQSGGERTTATMSFLLALQQHVRSPFRAVDEYDIHMDPKNRELIAHILISSVKNTDSQYIVITPSQITFGKENVNIITVQNVEGKSIIRGVA